MYKIRRYRNLMFKRFGKLVVHRYSRSRPSGHSSWYCRCDCGNWTTVNGSDLERGHTTSCGCYQKQRASEANFVDLAGKRFRRLVALSTVARGDSLIYWKCLCDCGQTTVVLAANLVRGNTKSCGCLNIDSCSERFRTHGLSGTFEHRVWKGVKGRCSDPGNTVYHNYGGRGIKVCDRWEDSFENFLEDMGKAPEGQTIERIDVNGNYEPSNCRWATYTEQARNRRNTRKIIIEGKQAPLIEVAEKFNVSYRHSLYLLRTYGEGAVVSHLKDSLGDSYQDAVNVWKRAS